MALEFWTLRTKPLLPFPSRVATSQSEILKTIGERLEV